MGFCMRMGWGRGGVESKVRSMGVGIFRLGWDGVVLIIAG